MYSKYIKGKLQKLLPNPSLLDRNNTQPELLHLVGTKVDPVEHLTVDPLLITADDWIIDGMIDIKNLCHPKDKNGEGLSDRSCKAKQKLDIAYLKMFYKVKGTNCNVHFGF